MESLLLMLFGTLWLMFFVKTYLNKKQKGRHIPRDLKEPDAPWVETSCHCGLSREEWRILAANRSGLRFLLVCPKCGTKWEEGTLGKRSRWREVNDEYIGYHYEIK